MDTETISFDEAFDQAWDQAEGGGEDVAETPLAASDVTEKIGEDSTDEVESETDKPETQEPVKETQDSEPLAAPVFLGEGAKAAFYKLDRAAQELFLEAHKGAQADYTRKTQEIASKAKEVEGLEEAFGEFEADVVASGIPKPQLVRQMLAWNNLINRDPVAAINKIASIVGIDLSQAQRTQEQSQRDPATSQLEYRLALLERERAEAARQADEARQAAEATQRAQQLEQSLQSLAEEKDGAGNSVRPLFTELIPAVVGLVHTLASQPEHADKSEIELVDMAYRQAYQPYKQLKSAERDKLVQKSTNARKASSSIGSSSGNGVKTAPKVKGTDAAVDAAYEELGL
jgi:hypothetical protein